MKVMGREPGGSANTLLQDFLALETPEGYRAELIAGEIVVTPLPDGNHECCIAEIVGQVLASGAARMDFSGHKGLVLPGADGGAYVIPDITFAPRKLDLFLDAPPWMPAAGVAMVAPP